MVDVGVSEEKKLGRGWNVDILEAAMVNRKHIGSVSLHWVWGGWEKRRVDSTFSRKPGKQKRVSTWEQGLQSVPGGERDGGNWATVSGARDQLAEAP